MIFMESYTKMYLFSGKFTPHGFLFFCSLSFVNRFPKTVTLYVLFFQGEILHSKSKDCLLTKFFKEFREA